MMKLLMAAIFSHSYLPSAMMCTAVIPLLQDKIGDITDKNNYRPIALTTVISKLIERSILQWCAHCLSTSGNQFSVTHKHTTDMAVFSLKETINIYRRESSPVYLCFLDASKAFDKINYCKLFDKLLKRDVPRIIVRLLAFFIYLFIKTYLYRVIQTEIKLFFDVALLKIKNKVYT